MVQHDTRWFVAHDRFVFLIAPSSRLLRVGEIYGFHERLARANPVLLDVIEPDAWDVLFAAMPGFPVERLVREGLTPLQKLEAIARRARGDETVEEIGRSYNVSGFTISNLPS